MTLKELSEKYNIAESTIKTAFPRVQKNIEKKYGVRINKIGRGAAARFEEDLSDNRAITMYEEKGAMLSKDSLKLIDWDFMVFLALLTTPMLVFRGSYEDFLKYADLKVSADNVIKLKLAIESLVERDYVMYVIDKTDNNFFTLSLYRQVEKELSIGIDMVCRCKRLAEMNHKRSWIPLLKTWLGIQIAAEEQPFTLRRLEEITGLSKYTLTESKKLLEKDNVFRTSKAYAAYDTCIGQNVSFNGFYIEEG